MIPLPSDLSDSVRIALSEDIQDGDLSASLIPEHHTDTATIISREPAIISGIAYVNEVFAQLDPTVSLTWHVSDGDTVNSDALLCTLSGSSRSLLTGERTALNFLQSLSATATTVSRYVDLVKNTQVKLLDTRKTIPGLRLAQKYAVACGGGHNHRIGLFDAFLIKENHIAAAGGITQAIMTARAVRDDVMLEVEVENFDELNEAIAASPDRIMLDNFSIDDMCKAVSEKPEGIEYEASGNITAETLLGVAETGVDYISIGALTKDIKAIDLSMRFVDKDH